MRYYCITILLYDEAWDLPAVRGGPSQRDPQRHHNTAHQGGHPREAGL